MIKPDGQILVIFGASGDLTKRKLLPSLYELFARDMLPENFVILGVARTPFSDEEFRIQQKDNLKAFLKGKHPEAKQLDAFLERVHYLGFNSDEAAEYHLLVEKIAELRKAKDIPDHLIFYLATPPQKYGPIAEALRKSKLNKASEEGGWRRIIVEKPFGSSLETAQALNKQLCSIFDEEDIYRIDHFLGKETVQNILVLRFANQIFESLWNRNYIDSIEIYAAEKLGVENRGKYYEGAGALRDMNDVIRGQYIAGKAGEESVVGYREENGVAADSTTETYIAMRFFIDNWRWGGVPFYFYTGKRMQESRSEIVIHFKNVPHRLFSGICPRSSCNELILKVDSPESISLKFGLKVPGSFFEVKQVSMNFAYDSLCNTYIANAYERLLLDAMQGDSTLYTRTDALELSWRFIDPILKEWAKDPAKGLTFYPAGSNGPEERKWLLHYSL